MILSIEKRCGETLLAQCKAQEEKIRQVVRYPYDFGCWIFI
jgi:hypothetical protein